MFLENFKFRLPSDTPPSRLGKAAVAFKPVFCAWHSSGRNRNQENTRRAFSAEKGMRGRNKTAALRITKFENREWERQKQLAAVAKLPTRHLFGEIMSRAVAGVGPSRGPVPRAGGQRRESKKREAQRDKTPFPFPYSFFPLRETIPHIRGLNPDGDFGLARLGFPFGGPDAPKNPRILRSTQGPGTELKIPLSGRFHTTAKIRLFFFGRFAFPTRQKNNSLPRFQNSFVRQNLFPQPAKRGA